MNHRDQKMMEEWQEEDDFDAEAYMQSKEYLVDKLLVCALDDICRLVDMANIGSTLKSSRTARNI